MGIDHVNGSVEAMRLAYEWALTSPDPSTQNGAVIVDSDGFILGLGCNDFALDVKKKVTRLERPLKYSCVEHAERSAIFDAVRGGNGDRLKGATMVALWAACADCARAIIECQIGTVVTHSFYRNDTERDHAGDRKNWDEEIDIAFVMLEEAGVTVQFADFKVMDDDEMPLRYSGSEVRY